MKYLLATTALIILPIAGAQAATVSTLDKESTTIISWGQPNTGTYGQTITLTEGMSLDSVTFRIEDYGSSITYDLYVYAWDGSKATGPALNVTSGTTAGLKSMQNVTTTTGGVDLDAGEYVISYQATSSGSSRWGATYNDASIEGNFVYMNNGNDTGQHTSHNWSQFVSYDLAYSFEFSEIAPVPLPASLPILASGLAIAGFVGRRRKKAA